MIYTPKATSVLETGEPDGWEIEPGWHGERTFGGETRLIVSAPTSDLARVHAALVGALAPPLGLLYRQHIDRRSPRPEGSPPRDFVALELDPGRIVDALAACDGLVYHDARCELWLRGALGDRVILDPDGLLYCYPDDPAFRDALLAVGLPERDVKTLVDRDYVRHWFHAENDEIEDQLRQTLRLAEVPARG